ncbi:hypothetical protein CCMA1212_001862 [Trichoderma ghanense]|uniref:Uncharacterized protein n=1 Tax=Trichoderma ghanense TaxID=65468 RepID=A0ABY2HBP3_9HYPO
MRAADDVVAGDLVFGCDAGRRRGTHQIGALCCDEDAGAVVCMGGILYGRICMGEGEGERVCMGGEGQAAFLLWASD